jgi:hypothetical protein
MFQWPDYKEKHVLLSESRKSTIGKVFIRRERTESGRKTRENIHSALTRITQPLRVRGESHMVSVELARGHITRPPRRVSVSSAMFTVDEIRLWLTPFTPF